MTARTRALLGAAAITAVSFGAGYLVGDQPPAKSEADKVQGVKTITRTEAAQTVTSTVTSTVTVITTPSTPSTDTVVP